jgi:hypothetical protein
MARRGPDNRREMADLQIQLKDTDRELGQLNWDLAHELITLADQSKDPLPLIQAVEALRSATRYFTFEDAPDDHAMIQKVIADTLLKLGQTTGDRDALTAARDAYRCAITLASLLSDEELRDSLRVSYKATQDLLGYRPSKPSLFRVA